LKVGDQYEFLAEREKAGKAVPPFFSEMPELTYWEMTLWQAFSKLSNRRQSGFGLSPISYQDIILFLDQNRISDPEIREDYEHFISFLDNEFLKRKNEEHEKKRSQPKLPAAGRQPALPPPRR